MSRAVLSHLLQKVTELSEATRLRVLQDVNEGRAAQALDVLASPALSVNRDSKAWGALQMYLLHLAGRYAQANQVLDHMIGLNLSEQLTIDNCPTEADIMARWDPAAEGVSVLCTTFNHARFIDMALASFFSQVSTHPFEVIVRDDASTDGTGALLNKWEQRYPRLLKVIRLSENTYQQGQSPMLAALAYAQYPLLALCEGDDFWVDNQKLQIQAEMLTQNPTWSAVTHNHFELDEAAGRLLPGRQSKIRGFLARNDLLNVHLVLWLHTLMIRKNKLNLPPYSHLDGVLGDQVWTACLGLGGEVYFRGDLLGSVARRNLASTYTPLLEMDKQKKRIQTRRFLATLMTDLGERQAAGRLLRWCEQAQRSNELALA